MTPTFGNYHSPLVCGKTTNDCNGTSREPSARVPYRVVCQSGMKIEDV